MPRTQPAAVPAAGTSRQQRMILGAIAVADACLTVLVFWVLGFTGPRNVALAAAVAAVFLVMAAAGLWVLRWNFRAAAARQPGTGGQVR